MKFVAELGFQRTFCERRSRGGLPIRVLVQALVAECTVTVGKIEVPEVLRTPKLLAACACDLQNRQYLSQRSMKTK